MPYASLLVPRNPSAIVWTGLALLATFAASRIVTYNRNLKRLGHFPGLRTAYNSFSVLGLIFAKSSWSWFPGVFLLWTRRHDFYKPIGAETISWISWLTGEATIFSSNIEVMRTVAPGMNSDWHKPDFATAILRKFGSNVLAAAGGDAWRSHRRIMGPAFSRGLYMLVWRKTIAMYRDMSATEGWTDQRVVEIERAQEYTVKFALLILSNCCFGLKFDWAEPPTAVDAEMSLLKSLEIVNSQAGLVLGAIPSWIIKLPFKYFRDYVQACNILTKWMNAQVIERRDIVKSRSDLDRSQLEDDCFTVMVKANEEEEEGSKFRMSDQDLVGNLYILLFAGHETTAHALAGTLAHLAVNRDIQDEIVEQIISVVGWDRDPEFDDYVPWIKCWPRSMKHPGYTVRRRFSPSTSAFALFRESTVDTTLPIQAPRGEEGTTRVPVPKGTLVVVDLVGVLYNERYFDEPEKFKPWRWLGLPATAEAATFGVGSRTCIGRQFATTEAVAFLTMFLRDWEVEPLLRSGETVEGWKKRVLEDVNIGLALGIKNSPIKLVRRERSRRV
ncbi:cytochrome P450 [Coprinopsis marcescibilis]|uniref:Cytochrome P450 n=1 Tax=Coprinopsis marcescibilis TaxID=230819 RepID=A0A5C3LJ86_COPMA|nr:cytochrome P450 [Coprinopsis marcescibilis]